jgi:hypothetical protein
MSLLSLSLVVLAAFIHATWNSLSKRAANAGPTFVFAYRARQGLARDEIRYGRRLCSLFRLRGKAGVEVSPRVTPFVWKELPPPGSHLRCDPT